MSSPAVSVLIAVHNGMPYLPETIESIRSQSFRDFEVVLVDDGSTDETPRFIQAIDDPRIVYYRNKSRGFVNALNYGLQLARAPVVARMDADDLALPTRLERQYQYLRDHPECVLVGCDYYDIDGNSEIVSENDYNYASDRVLRWLLLICNPFIHPGVSFRRSTVADLGGYRREYESAEDYDLWTRICAVGKVANIPCKLMKKRYHSNSMSVIRRATQSRHAGTIAANYAKSQFPSLDPANVEALCRFMSDRVASPVPIFRLLAEFREMVRLACSYTPDAADETAAAIEQIRHRLGWLCHAVAQRNLVRPGVALSYLRAGAAFDPDNRRLGRVARNKLCRQLFGGPGDEAKVVRTTHSHR